MKISISNGKNFALNFLPESKEDLAALNTVTSNMPLVIVKRDKQEKVSVFSGHEFHTWNGVDLKEIVANRFN